MKIKNNPSIRKDQSGIASMVIVILIMTLLTLIVLSMTQNSNREQRQALDRQLNSQAFYAAESGVGDAKDYVVQQPGAPIKKEKCDHTETGAAAGDQFPTSSSKIINSADPSIDNVSYSCVLYNRVPKSLEFSSVGVSSPEIIPIEDAGGVAIQSLTFTWTKEGGGNNFVGCPTAASLATLPPSFPVNCEAGMLRIELLDPASPNRQALIDRTFLTYLKPTNTPTASTLSYTSASGSVNAQGALINGGCDANGCRATINNIPANKLYLHLRSLYRSNKVSITGVTVAGTEVQFRNAQMEVDSTGKVGDILKRIQVRIPLSGQGSGVLPEFSLQSTTDICKQLQVRPNEVIDGC